VAQKEERKKYERSWALVHGGNCIMGLYLRSRKFKSRRPARGYGNDLLAF